MAIITIITFLFGFILSQIHLMHLFQLNSYSEKEQINRFKENRSDWIFYPVFFLVSLAGIWFAKILMPICYLVMGLFNLPRKAKKPLVYTKRVKRMFATEILVFLIVFGICFLLGEKALFVAMAILTLLSPFYSIVANFINKPIEKEVNNYFIRDAKKILKSHPDLKIIGVTGSYGKTSVKYYLNTLLKAKYNVLMTPESYNTPMGVCMTIRGALRATHEIFICEMGAKKVGEIKEICDIVNPDHGIITSIGPQHLETFGSLDNVKSTKFELANALSKDGLLFLNGDDENIKDYNKNENAITYSMTSGDYTAYDITTTEKGTTFFVKSPTGEVGEFTTKLIGKHNVVNITGAVAISNTLGISMKELKPQVRKLECVPHRLELLDNGNAIVIDDAYNSNPSGTKAALETLSLINGYKILVTPGMVELGEKQSELNTEFGENAARVADYVIIVGKINSSAIEKGLKKAQYPADKYFMAPTIADAVQKAYELDTNGKKRVILLENDLPDNY